MYFLYFCFPGGGTGERSISAESTGHGYNRYALGSSLTLRILL